MDKRYCENCNRMTDDNCQNCPDFEPVKVMLLVDATKNIVPLTAEEINKMLESLGEYKLREILNERVVRHDTLEELDKDIHQFFKHTKEVINANRRKH